MAVLANQQIEFEQVMSEPRTDINSSYVHQLQQEACDVIWAADPKAACLIGPVSTALFQYWLSIPFKFQCFIPRCSG
jgi:hypothetical protein